MIKRVLTVVGVLVGGFIVLNILLSVVLFGVRGGGGGDDHDDDAAPEEPAEKQPSPTSPTTVPVAPTSSLDVGLNAGAVPGPAVERLPDEAVLRVTAFGFSSHAGGTVSQCSGGTCVNPFPVQFDGGGMARFQYQVHDRVAGSECGAADPPCVLTLSADEQQAQRLTVFRDPAPAPARVAVEPSSGVDEGDVVTVRVSGLPGGTAVVATQCPIGAGVAADACGQPVDAVTGPAGVASLRLTVHTGSVGGGECGRRDTCEIRVSTGIAVPPVATPLSFAPGPTPRYDVPRLLAGLLVAAMLLLVATRLVRTTDWRKPREAATPEMDRAVLEV